MLVVTIFGWHVISEVIIQDIYYLVMVCKTLGVALPWAISAALVRPNTQVVSVKRDGGFLFSSQDLETAVRKNLNIIQLIWNDGKYNMVEFQEEMKYKRSSGVDFGPVDFVKICRIIWRKRFTSY